MPDSSSRSHLASDQQSNPDASTPASAAGRAGPEIVKVVHPFPDAGTAHGQHPTTFQAHKRARDEAGLPSHAPFASRGEWELAELVVESGITQRDTDRLLKTDMVSCNPRTRDYMYLTASLQFSRCRAAAPQDYSSYRDNSSFQKSVDSLPGPRASWKMIEITVTGTRRDARGQVMKEVLDCWARDPVEVITDLLGNPEFRGEQQYAPYIQLLEELTTHLEGADEEDRDQVFDEMASTEWWRRLQVLRLYLKMKR